MLYIFLYKYNQALASTTFIRVTFKLLKKHAHIQANTLRIRTHFLITGANLVKTITQLIESSLVDECIKHMHTLHMDEESLQGRLSYLLSHFSYQLGFVSSHWGGNAIFGAAHSGLQISAKKKKNRQNMANLSPSNQSLLRRWLTHEVTFRGCIYMHLSASVYDSRMWRFSYGNSGARRKKKHWSMHVECYSSFNSMTQRRACQRLIYLLTLCNRIGTNCN